MRNGTIVHSVVLDGVPLDDLVAISADDAPHPATYAAWRAFAALGDEVGDHCARIPDDAPQKRSKADKAWWKDFEAAHPGKRLVKADDWAKWEACASHGRWLQSIAGKEIVTRERYDTIAGAAAAVLADPTAAWLIENSKREASIFWVETHDGIDVRCKARIDILAELGDRLAVYDLKTNGRGVDRKTVRYAISDSGLPIQLAWYKRAATLAFDRDVASAGIISTFMGEPFDAVCDPLMDVDEVDEDDGFAYSGEALFSRAMELCEKAIGKVARPPAHGGCAPVDEHGRPMPRRLRIHPRTLDKYDN
jgi:hypothetical protein